MYSVTVMNMHQHAGWVGEVGCAHPSNCACAGKQLNSFSRTSESDSIVDQQYFSPPCVTAFDSEAYLAEFVERVLTQTHNPRRLIRFTCLVGILYTSRLLAHMNTRTRAPTRTHASVMYRDHISKHHLRVVLYNILLGGIVAMFIPA